MKITAKLLLAIIISVLYSGLAAQFPTNFEFLEHHHAKSTLGVQKIHNDEIYFTSFNNYKPHSLVSRVSADGSFEVLLKPTYEARSSKLFVESDTSFQIVLYNLIDYDVPMGGIYVVNVSGSEYSIDTIIDHTVFPSFSTSFHNIEKDADGNWISIADQVYRFDNSGYISREALPTNSHIEFNSNHLGDLFLIEYLANNKSRLSKYENGNLSLLHDFNEENQVTQLLSCDLGNFLSSGDKLQHYNHDFSTLLNSWNSSKFEGKLESAVYNDGLIEVITSTEDQFYIYSINGNDEFELIFQVRKKNGDEVLSHFEKLNDEQYLYTGTYSVEDISRNIFFRNTNIIDNSNVDYPKTDLALDKVEITLTKKDTYDIIVSTPDTFYGISYHYDISTSVTNESNEDIIIANAISERYSSYPYHINLEVDSLAANSSDIRQTSTSILNSSNSLDGIKVALPGGNYKFNKNENKVVIAKTSSTINLEKTKLLLLYPNPVSDLLKLNNDESLGSITIYDERGQMVYYSSENDKEVNVSYLKPGNYILSLRSLASNHKSFGKFIKI